MRDRKLDKLFDRFRTRGDAMALGRVFDATAPELLRVAMSLVPGPAEADDLLQATYLTAIEKAAAYDADRRLVPWLIGILVRHAHDQRRKRDREVDPERLASREVQGPHSEAEIQELSEALESALGRLPRRYSEVLRPFLREGEGAADIAKRTGQAPGTVRMQIHRGLDLLRKALPAGFAFGAMGIATGPGLGVVRAKVLHAGAAAGSGLVTVSAVAVPTSALGGIAMAKKVALVAGIVSLAAGLTWVANIVAGTTTDPVDVDSPLVAVDDESENARRAGAPSLEAPDASAETLAELKRVPYATGTETESSSFERALARVSGRVIDADGDPIVGVPITLFEARADGLQVLLDDSFLGERPGPQLAISNGVTDSNGNFSLGGARTHAAHVFGIDLGGNQPTWRGLDHGLQPGETRDVGDIVLAAVVSAVGRVVDASGAPLAGVRVRAANLPSTATELGFGDLRAGDPILVSQSIVKVVIDQPGWVAALEKSLPFATTTTDEEGHFQLDGLPAENPVLVFDHEGFTATTAFPEFEEPVNKSEPVAIGDFKLASGRAVTGKVVDSEGAPLEDVEIRGGSILKSGWTSPSIGVMAAGARSDEEGAFAMTGLHPEGELVLIGRKSPRHRWTILVPKQGKEVVLELPAEVPITVHLRTPSGAILPDADLSVLVPLPNLGRPHYALFDAGLAYGTPRKVEDGTYAIDGLARGTYVLRGRADGFTFAEESLRAKRKKGAEITLTFQPAIARSLRVIDKKSKEPVAGARIAAGHPEVRSALMERAVSDATGAATFQRLIEKPEAPYKLRVEHPAYAVWSGVISESGETVVELEPGGKLLAHVRSNGTAPPRPLMLTVDLDGGGVPFPDDEVKRMALSDADGDLVISHLPPGKHEWVLYERYLNGDLIAYAAGTVWPESITRGSTEITAGETQELWIDLTDTGLFPDTNLPLGSIAGRIRIDGEPGRHMSIRATTRYDGESSSQGSEVDGRGDFDLGALPAGQVAMHVQATTFNPDGWSVLTIYTAKFELLEGQEQFLDLDWKTSEIRVSVATADGTPVEGANVQLEGGSDNYGGTSTPKASSAHDGVASLKLLGSGDFKVTAMHNDFGLGRSEVHVPADGGGAEAHVEMDAGVPCAGKIEAPGFVPSEWGGYLRVSQEDGWRRQTVNLNMQDGKADFAAVGLVPGTYSASLRTINQAQSRDATFSLGPDGDAKLTLNFAANEAGN